MRGLSCGWRLMETAITHPQLNELNSCYMDMVSFSKIAEEIKSHPKGEGDRPFYG